MRWHDARSSASTRLTTHRADPDRSARRRSRTAHLAARVVPFRLDALHFGEQRAPRRRERVGVGPRASRYVLLLACARPSARRVGQQPVHDAPAGCACGPLRAAHVADARAKLHERVPAYASYSAQHDLPLVGRGHEADVRQIRIADEVQRHEIRARLLDRRIAVPSAPPPGVAMSAPAHPGPIRGPMTLVDLRRELARRTAPSARRGPLRPRSRRTPGGSCRHRARRGLRRPVTFESVHRLAAVLSRGSRWSFGRLTPIGVIGPASPVSMTTSTARRGTRPSRVGLRYCGAQGIRSSNHCACVGERADLVGLLVVRVVDNRLPTRPSRRGRPCRPR